MIATKDLLPRGVIAIAVIALALIFTPTAARAASPGSIDPSFDPGSGLDVSKSLPVRVIFPLPDGSFLLGGFFTNYNGVYRPALAKVLENGALDETFVPDPSFSVGNTEVWSIAQQPDGKFIVSGITGGSQWHAMIARLNSNGCLDPTFTFAYRQAAFGMAVDVRPDGLISYLTDDNFGIGLLRPDGTRLLTSGPASPFGLFDRIRRSAEGHSFYSFNGGLFRFGGTFGLPDDVQFLGGGGATYDFDFQSDGRIVCTSSGAGGLRRYFPNGSLDATFQSGSAGDIDTVVCLPDDKILVAGRFTGISGAARKYLARLNADGKADTNFISSAGPNAAVMTIAPIRNGKALIAGEFTSYDGLSRTGIARIFLDAPDNPIFVTQPNSTNLLEGQTVRLSVAVHAALPISYQWKKDGQPIGGATNSVLFVPRIAKDQTGAYVVTVNCPGGTATSDEATITIAPSPVGVGSLDIAFADGEGAGRAVNAYLPLSNGQSLIAGNFLGYDGQLRPALARLNTDGSLDSSFDLNLPPGATCTSLARQPGGKILAGFLSFRPASTYLPVLMRLKPDGSPDASFFPSFSSDILAIAPLEDGKILIGGAFTTLGAVTRTRLARLNPDCTLDQSFDANALQLTKVFALAVQSDGKIIVCDQYRVLRISANGAVETDLPLTGPGRALAIEPDGKILLGGHFTAIAGAARTNLARLNSDMTVDAGFTPAAGAASINSSSILSLTIQPDQKIIVGGTFSDLAGTSCTNLARLLPNGAIDPTFRPDINLGAPSTRVAVNTMTLGDDGTLTIGGLFSRVNGYTRNSIARLYTSAPTPKLSATVTPSNGGEITSVTLSFVNDPSFNYTVQFTDTFPANWQDLMVVSDNANSAQLPFSGTQRFYRVKQTPR